MICLSDSSISNVMFLVICEQPSDQDYAGGLQKRQKVFEFDMAIWEVSPGCFLSDPKLTVWSESDRSF